MPYVVMARVSYVRIACQKISKKKNTTWNPLEDKGFVPLDQLLGEAFQQLLLFIWGAFSHLITGRVIASNRL